jgi:hypothetical protein
MRRRVKRRGGYFVNTTMAAAIHVAASFYIAHRLLNHRDDHRSYSTFDESQDNVVTVTTAVIPVTAIAMGVKKASREDNRDTATRNATTLQSGNLFRDLYGKRTSPPKSDGTMAAAAPSQQAP